MLIELGISNLAVIDHARIVFGPGLNALTGETGAGKSIVIDAVGLLMGGRADTGMIRSGAPGARVEGIFQASAIDLAPLEEAGLAAPGDDVLILARELASSGRTVCRVNGRAVPVRMLQEVGERLIDIHGQSAHLSLLRVPEHVELLDRWAGLGELRRQATALRARLRRLDRELTDLRGDERELARRADLLRHQIEEIARARLEVGEEDELRRAQRIHANAEQILQLAGESYAAVAGGGEDASSARDLLGAAAQRLARLQHLDPSVSPLAEMAEAAGLQLEELGAALRSYRDGIEYDPERLAEVEERLGVIFSLKRKYGGTVEEILAFAEGAEGELAGLAGREQAIAALEADEASLHRELGSVAGELSAGRRRAARSLERHVEEQLGTLAMPGSFGVQFGPEAPLKAPDKDRAEPSAAELEPVEFLLSLNPGEPPRPLAKIASGGETSRVMLAIKAALTGADPHPTLVFDEIDSGIGGRVGEVVGRKLWDLARHSQVLAVTHLPQIAAYADVHLHVGKHVAEGRTVTRVESLGAEDRLDELSDMFGSDREAGRLQATALLDRARAAAEEARITPEAPQRNVAAPVMGSGGGEEPSEPLKATSPKANIPPSAPTSR
jgi:DNA repair protein RecN (Recombination protein N)